MIFLASIRIALEQIWANKLRTMLTLLGMLIGVGSVIAIVSIGEGMRRMVIAEFGKLGGDSFVYILPQQRVLKDGRWVSSSHFLRFTMDDLYAVESVSDRIVAILPALQSSANLQYRKASYQGALVATLPAHATVYNWDIAEGRFLIDRDLEQMRRVCVLGQEARDEIFGEGPFLGREIKLNGQRYTVIGLMSERKLFGNDFGNQILVPVTTAQRRLFGNKYIGGLIAHAHSGEDVPAITAAIEKGLRKRHGHQAQYQIISGSSILEQVEQTILIMKMVTGGIAAISLLVGGIGIMNIMLVSVAERTREIGIRKALGAKPATLLWQFVLESITLSLVGGLLGIGFGYGLGEALSYAIDRYADQQFPSVISADATVLALCLSTAIGLFFGIYPASRAAKLDSVEALHSE
jgi:putative ABC transport system permease protein